MGHLSFHNVLYYITLCKISCPNKYSNTKYQKYYKEGALKEAVPHLFIICDEFAELKNNQPEFMDNLISVARIGRSLGIHLILATQKPSGIVNDQIWSNTRFRICLKVQDENDSREVIKKNDAAYLKNAGSFYLQVGNDEYYAQGQSGWCGAKYYQSDEIYKQIDKDVCFIDNTGEIIKKSKNESNNKVVAQGEQLASILQEIIKTSKETNVYSRQLWLNNIPEKIYIQDLEKKYNVSYQKPNIVSILGEYDEPENQKQDVLIYNFLEKGNTIIYGIDGSERENLLKTMIFSSIKNSSVEEINYYIIDYGAETFRKFEKIPHIGEIVYLEDEEKFNKLLKMIKETIRNRKKILADYGGEYINYIKSGQPMPLKVIILNNYDSIYENNKNLYDELPELVRDSERYGFIFIITCNSSNSVHSRISQNFRNMYSFKLKDEIEYSTIFSKRNRILLSDIYGRGLANINGVHEFQTSTICPHDQFNEYMNKVIDYLTKINTKKAEGIPILPEKILIEDIVDDKLTLSSIPIGINKDNLNICKIDLVSNDGIIISSKKIDNCTNFCKSLCDIIGRINNVELIVVDSEQKLENCVNEKNYIANNFENFIDRIIKYITQLSNYSNIDKGRIIIINGIEKFLSEIKDKSKIEEFFNLCKNNKNISIIIVDTDIKLKNLIYENWFKTIFNTSNGIWIGHGINNQGIIHLVNVTKEMNNNYNNDMGYIINDGYANLMKVADFYSEEDLNDE